MLRVAVIVAVMTAVAAVPMKMYEKSDNEKFQPVLVPVSSTVIPLDDLPVYQVGVGVGIHVVTQAPGIFKPDEPTKLITIHSIKRDKNKKKAGTALIEEVTQEEYKKLAKQ
ncbi:uncharacterized protein [Macrobrachium rosenbergii]|uniref:uncharacterized protein n=1 Tax=Macrobrachium rosenbergii TaxID=79674 RepID=UPI0034D54D68